MRINHLRRSLAISPGRITLLIALLFGLTACYKSTTDSLPELGLMLELQKKQLPTVLYATSSGHNGSLGGRSGADALCANDKATAGRTCNSVHALLSFSGDTIAGMASTYSIPDAPIKSPGGLLVGNNWADLLDGSIAVSMQDASVSSNAYWTFSNADGSSNSNNCTDGTVTTGGGQYGDFSSATGSWLNSGSTACTTSSYVFLCICY